MKHFLLLPFLVFTYLAESKIYKWKDEQGNIHYSETKSDHLSTEEIKFNPSQPNTNSINQNLKEESNSKQDTSDRLQKFAKNDQYRRNKEKAWKSRCRQAKNSMKQLKKSFSNYKIDSNTGGRIYTSYRNESKIKARQQERIRKKQIYVNKMCKRG